MGRKILFVVLAVLVLATLACTIDLGSTSPASRAPTVEQMRAVLAAAGFGRVIDMTPCNTPCERYFHPKLQMIAIVYLNRGFALATTFGTPADPAAQGYATRVLLKALYPQAVYQYVADHAERALAGENQSAVVGGYRIVETLTRNGSLSTLIIAILPEGVEGQS